MRLDPRHNVINIVRKHTSREDLMEKKQFVKRFIQLHLSFIRG